MEEAISPLGCKVESFYFALGDDDVYLVLDAPDHATATAVSLATNASGAVRVKTTALMTPQDMDEAVKKFVSYKASGS